MVELRSSHLDAVFHALADPTRRAMLLRLAEGERSVTQLAEPFSISLAGASKHVKVLEGAGLLRRRVTGRIHYCRLEPARLAEAHRWLAHYERFWTERLDTLEALLRDEDEAAHRPPRKATHRKRSGAHAPTGRRKRQTSG